MRYRGMAVIAETRRGRGRDRHSVQRPSGRRPEYLGLLAARPGRRHDDREGARYRSRRAHAVPDLPIILMTYYDPIHRYGLARYAADANAAGVDGTS